MVNTRGLRFLYCARVILSRPVALSRTPPVADWYFWNASEERMERDYETVDWSMGVDVPVAIKVNVVPVSTIPAVVANNVLSP